MKDNSKHLSEGKLPIQLLNELIQFKGVENPGVLYGPAIGLDAAVIDLNKAAQRVRDFYQSDSDLLVVKKTDPITFSTPNPGNSAIKVNSNDVVCTGAIPLFFNATIIVPPGFNYQELLSIQKSISHACEDQGIAITGGHTEISSGVNRPIIAGTMIGLVPNDYLVKSEFQEGDFVVIAGHAGLEGTHILLETGFDLFVRLLGESKVKHASQVSAKLSVAEKALEINKKYKPLAMHDPTEGGVMGALYEFTHSKKLGISLNKEGIPVMEVTLKICNELEIDPLQLISSGALLIAINEENANEMVKEFDSPDYPVKIIGTFTKKAKSLPQPGPDHIIKGLEKLEELLVRKK
ncbi:MAG: AIR synthase-related protein [Candidatus Hodarchaeales archaeon]